MAENKRFVLFDGTKTEFQNGDVEGYISSKSIVFITGGADESSCIFVMGTYFGDFAEFIKTVAYIKGYVIDNASYVTTASGGFINFIDSDYIDVTYNNGVKISLSEAFVNEYSALKTEIGKTTDVAAEDGTIYAKLKYLLDAIDSLTGGQSSSISAMINEAIEELRTEIVGTLDNSDARTIAKLNDEIDALQSVLNNINSDYLNSEDKTELQTAIDNKAVRITETNGAEGTDILKTYTFTQGGATIGKINLAKDLIIQSATIGVNSDGVKCIIFEIVLTNGSTTSLYIPIDELVEAYTAGDGINISDDNVISINETWINSKISEITYNKTTINSMINDVVSSVSTTYATKGELNTGLQNANDYADSLADNYATKEQGAKADTAVQSVTGETTYIDVETTTNGVVITDETLAAKLQEIESNWEWAEISTTETE